MHSATFVLAVTCLVAAVHSLPAPAALGPSQAVPVPAAASPAKKDALEPKDDLKTDSTYGLGYATYPLGYYGSYSYGYPSYGYPAYGYGLGYSYGYPKYYYGYGYPSYSYYL